MRAPAYNATQCPFCTVHPGPVLIAPAPGNAPIARAPASVRSCGPTSRKKTSPSVRTESNVPFAKEPERANIVAAKTNAGMQGQRRDWFLGFLRGIQGSKK